MQIARRVDEERIRTGQRICTGEAIAIGVVEEQIVRAVVRSDSTKGRGCTGAGAGYGDVGCKDIVKDRRRLPVQCGVDRVARTARARAAVAA